MEYIGYIAAFLTTVSFLPQVILTIRTKDTRSLSVTMYVVFVSGTICWFIYGIMLGSIPMIIANSITVLLSSMVLFIKIQEVVKHANPPS